MLSQRQRKLAVTALTLAAAYVALKQNKRRRWWVRPINANRRDQGDYENLLIEMRLWDQDMFFNYTRLSITQFDLLLSWVGPALVKNSLRESIAPGARLALTLRHLAAGDSIPSLSFSYRIGRSTTCTIINETCEAIWTTLHPRVLPEPSKNNWQKISEGFQDCWNLPNCVGALDGKHVRIRAPDNSGSAYFNYKKCFSIVLFALCDHNYCFTYVDVGGYGSQSDGGILKASSLGHKLNNGLLDLPDDAPFPGTMHPKPYYLVGDEAFPLQLNLLRPYGGTNLSMEERIFNYRLSRARRCSENAFGILVARFRIFHTTIFKMPENVDKVVLACVCLHNFIKKQEDEITANQRKYCPSNFVDHELNGEVIAGEWRNNAPINTALRPVQDLRRRIGTRNSTRCAIDYRNYVKNYVNSDVGKVPWQYDALCNY